MNDPTSWREMMQEAARGTAPSAEQIARVQDGLRPVPALHAAPKPSAAAVARVTARVQASRGASTSTWARGGGLVLVTAVSLTAAWWFMAAPPLPRIDGGQLWLNDAPVGTASGEGEVAWVDGWLEVDWAVGTLTLPEGLATRVRTREGTFEAPAGGMTIERDTLGTRMVASAPVQAQCEGQGRAPSVAADCMPTSAPGWLGRAGALRQRSDAAGAADAVERGLSLVGEGPVAGELWSLRADLYAETGNWAEAERAAAQALDADAGAREEEMHRLIARIRLLQGDCAGAAVHLDRLSTLTSEEAAHRASCP